MRAPRFKPYPAYKDSGVEWLGEIPAGWQSKRLNFVAPLRASKLTVKADHALYVGLENIESWTGRLLLDTQPEVVDSVVGMFSAGDVLFGKLRPYLAKAASPDFDGVCTSEILAFRPTSGVCQRYVMYCLLNAPYIRWLDSLTFGTKMPRLNPEQVGSSVVSVPPEAEQRTIAAFLDRETARIDALVAKKERLIELLWEERTAHITRAVTKGLDPSAPMKGSGVEWLGEIPAHWGVKKVTWLFSIGSGTTPKSEDPAYYGGDTPWITTSELRESVILATEKNVTEDALRDYSSLKVHPKGSVAVAMYGATIGRLGILGVPAAVNQASCVFSGGKGIETQHWFYWLQMRKPYLISLGYGGGQPNLSQELLRSLRVPTPPVPEQRAIATFLDQEAARIDTLVAKVRDAIVRLKELRTALISAAVTGKIDVREKVA